MNGEPNIELIHEIRPAVAKHARRTPLLRSEWLSRLRGSEVFLKCENLQVTGSFKVRGAVASLSLLSNEQLSAGVVACSAGNHGLGLAYASKALALQCTIVVPRSIASVKESGIRSLGARVEKSPHDDYDSTQRWTMERLDELGGTFIHPYEAAAVIAGNGGSTMLEIMEDAPPLDAVVIPCGGGGCAIGAGIVAKDRVRSTRVIAVNSDASPGMWLSRRDSRAHLTVESQPTIADGLEGGVSEVSFQLGQQFIDDVVLTREDTIRRAVAEIARYEHLVVEGSGAAGVAALMDRRIPCSGPLCILLTGGNIDAELLESLLRDSSSDRSRE